MTVIQIQVISLYQSLERLFTITAKLLQQLWKKDVTERDIMPELLLE